MRAHGRAMRWNPLGKIPSKGAWVSGRMPSSGFYSYGFHLKEFQKRKLLKTTQPHFNGTLLEPCTAEPYHDHNTHRRAHSKQRDTWYGRRR